MLLGMPSECLNNKRSWVFCVKVVKFAYGKVYLSLLYDVTCEESNWTVKFGLNTGRQNSKVERMLLPHDILTNWYLMHYQAVD